MSFEKKLPSIRATLTIEDYNKLVELLTKTERINIEDIKEKGDTLKEKILMFSNPSDDKVQMRLYPSQMELILYILLANAKQVEVSEDYYKLLVENKEKYKKEKASEEAEQN